MFGHLLRYFSFCKKDLLVFHPESDYSDNLHKAFSFTKRLGFNEEWNGVTKNKEYDYQDVFSHVCLQSGVTDFSASAGQCLKWSHYFQPYFENILECRVWVTVGQLWKQERFIYNPSVADFQRWSEKGIQPEDFRHHSGFNFHAWLTTENGVIVDVSFMSTLSRRLPEHLSEVSGSVIIGTPETVLPEHKYVPMIVGQRIVEKIEKRSFIDFLAHDDIDLYTVPAILVPVWKEC